MDKELGKEIADRNDRRSYLADNCDKIEEKGYMKRISPKRLQEMKENLSETDIEYFDIEEEKKETMKDFKERLSPLADNRKRLLVGLKNKSEFVTKKLYKFINTEDREVGYYSEDGELVESRPAYSDELQMTIHQLDRKIV